MSNKQEHTWRLKSLFLSCVCVCVPRFDGTLQERLMDLRCDSKVLMGGEDS